MSANTTMIAHLCAHCGEMFFGKHDKRYCSERCRKTESAARLRAFRAREYARSPKGIADREFQARMARLTRRYAEARRALGKDAAGNVRGRIPGGCAGAVRTEFFSRWY